MQKTGMILTTAVFLKNLKVSDNSNTIPFFILISLMPYQNKQQFQDLAALHM